MMLSTLPLLDVCTDEALETDINKF